MMFVRGFLADQGGPQDWGKSKQFTTKPADLLSLTAVNKSGATVYVELYDTEDGTDTDLSGLIPEVLPLPDITAGGYAYWEQIKMRRGIFVGAVDAPSGGALIADDDVKFTCRYMDRIV